MFLAFRFFSGAGSFMILAVVPILMNEIVPVSLRGALVDIHGVMLVLGYTIQGWVSTPMLVTPDSSPGHSLTLPLMDCRWASASSSGTVEPTPGDLQWR